MAVHQSTWPSAEELEANRPRLLEELRRELNQYETRYELRSERVEEELKAGRLRETSEICDWVITYHFYQAVLRGSEARLE